VGVAGLECPFDGAIGTSLEFAGVGGHQEAQPLGCSMTAIEECSADQLREMIKDTERALFALEFCVCESCLQTPPEQTAQWIDETLALRAKIHVELCRRGEPQDTL
jgi:hypothetical protein